MLNISRLENKYGASLGATGLAVSKHLITGHVNFLPMARYIQQFAIDLDPNGRPFGFKSIGKW